MNYLLHFLLFNGITFAIVLAVALAIPNYSWLVFALYIVNFIGYIEGYTRPRI